jgi:hypothetical protein
MLDIYDAAKALGYPANYFRQMVLERGGVQTAHDLMAPPEVSDGFRTLAGLQALHLSVEAHVVRPEYDTLFSDTEIATARRRLADYSGDDARQPRRRG